MYESFFRLSRRPFAAAPGVENIVDHPCYVEARTALLRCVEDASGTAIVTADAGLGKSLLCQDLQHRLRDRFVVINLCTAQFAGRKALLQAILLELSAEFRGLAEDEARLAVIEAIRAAGREGEGFVLVIDEAHLLSAELLEELRLLADSSGSGRPMRLVLAGQLELEEKLGATDLAAFNQRIACHVVLDPLSHEDSVRYLAERLQRSGRGIDLFRQDAVAFLVTVSDGNPRCLNQLADHSLLSAFTLEEPIVSLETVRNALDDLRALPLHWNDVGVVSQGELDEEAEMEWREANRESAVHEAVMAAIPQATTDTPGARVDHSSAGVFEIGGSGAESASALFESATPWVAPEPRHEQPAVPPMVEPAEIDCESVVDDLYAQLDRESEFLHGAAIPQAPELMKFLAQFAVERRPVEEMPTTPAAATPHAEPEFGSDEDDAESLLITIRELQNQLRQKVAEEGADEDSQESWIDSLTSAYDLVEPDDSPVLEQACEREEELEIAEVPAAEVSLPIAPPPVVPMSVLPMPVAPAAVVTPTPLAVDPPSDIPAPRFAQLFTRLRQRRRATMERLERDTDLV